MHRFSNWEVLNAFNMRYFLAVLGLENPLSVTCEPESAEDPELPFE